MILYVLTPDPKLNRQEKTLSIYLCRVSKPEMLNIMFGEGPATLKKCQS